MQEAGEARVWKALVGEVREGVLVEPPEGFGVMWGGGEMPEIVDCGTWPVFGR